MSPYTLAGIKTFDVQEIASHLMKRLNRSDIALYIYLSAARAKQRSDLFTCSEPEIMRAIGAKKTGTVARTRQRLNDLGLIRSRPAPGAAYVYELPLIHCAAIHG